MKFQSTHHQGVSSKQRGVTLLIALIALIAMTLAGIALIRSLDTSNVIAGNLAFRQAALQASDKGIESAFLALPTIIATSRDTNIANQYYALEQALDSRGIPSGVNWANVPCRDHTNATVTCSTQDYQVKYVIERLCDSGATLPISDIQGKCRCDVGTGKGGSKGSFGTVFSAADAVYYRVTVQVTGPRSTQTFVQAILASG